MSLAAGTKLAHFEIVEPIGAGGMGEVYKARDRNLGRDVAIKLLPAEVADDAERLARFEREARLLASLNHQNIAHVYGFESSSLPDGSTAHFLAMELVDGEDLAERLERGPIPIDDAVALFTQLAEALEAAHAKGIIHRDLKPSNVMITPEGQVKVLDFGLAKVLGVPAASESPSESPTFTRSQTGAGVILGTAAYMSPEQARGKDLDKRTDVWAFGCCLFEALAGRPVFDGETVSDTLAKILETEPVWSALPQATPPSIVRLIRRCLTKEPRMRLHDIADARIELAQTLAEAPAPIRKRSRSAAALIAVAALATVIAAWSLTHRPAPPSPRVVRSVLPLPPQEPLGLFVTGGPSMAISPDGRYVAYVTGDQRQSHLYLRALDSLDTRRIEAGSIPRTPVFSPEGEWLGVMSTQTLMRAAVSGGGPVRLSDLADEPYGATWSRQGIIVTQGGGSGLFRIGPGGGVPEALTRVDEDRREKTHRFPQVLPGGRWVLFTVGTSTTDSWDDGLIAVGSMTTGEHRIVLEGGSHARYSRTGHLVYAHAGSLLAVPFDLERLEVRGQPVVVVKDVMTSPAPGKAEFALSDNGTLVYAPGRSHADDRAVVWVDPEGDAASLIETPQPFTALDLSPDGRYLALQVHGGLESVVVYDIARQAFQRLTNEWDNIAPLWSPSGEEIAFASARASAYDLYLKRVDGDEAIRIAASEFTKIPNSWSPDGSMLAFTEWRGGETGDDLFLLHLNDVPTREPFLETRASERWAAFSPNGEWIAYESNETARYEIYVCRFPDCSRKQPVSTDGGTYPAWNPNGKELLYRDGDKMMSVAVRAETESGLVLGEPRMLFQRDYGRTFFARFDVTSDGHFIDLDQSVAEPPPTYLVLVQHFDEELKRLVSVEE